MQAAVGNMPVMTQNEARKTYMGLGPIEGGEKLMVPGTMTEAGVTDQIEGHDATPQLAKTAEGWNAKAVRVRTGGKTASSSANRSQPRQRRGNGCARDDWRAAPGHPRRREHARRARPRHLQDGPQLQRDDARPAQERAHRAHESGGRHQPRRPHRGRGWRLQL